MSPDEKALRHLAEELRSLADTASRHGHYDRLNAAAEAVERLELEMAEARAQTRQAVRQALEEAAGAAYGTVSPSAAACAVFNRVHGMIARLDAEEPKP